VSGTWGSRIKYSIFGESHGNSIGIVIDGLPSGFTLDIDEIRFEMGRRKPGKNNLSTARKEDDEIEIVSGYFDSKTTGTPLCMIIKNKDQKQRDYEKKKHLLRPSHADYTGFIKYSGHNDYRGGGHFSGRLTAPLVFAGAIAKQILKSKDIHIGSRIYGIGDIRDIEIDTSNINSEMIKTLKEKELPIIGNKKEIEMRKVILNMKHEGDSIGGIIECYGINIPIGLGSPFFDSMESKLSSLLFSIPGVKGVEFGAGFDIASMKGSEANDEYYVEDKNIKTYTNNNGGIIGGITNGMPLVFRVAFKPTPSILKSQRTVDISSMKNTELKIEGRHDPCIVPRAVPVVEAVMAMVILDEINSF